MAKKTFTKFHLMILLASATLTVMAGGILVPVLNVIRDSFGLDQVSAGLIITTHSLFVALASPFVGILIDKIGSKKPFVFGLFLYGLAGGSGFFLGSFELLLLSRAFLGVSIALVFTSLSVMLLNVFQGQERNKALGWRGTANGVGGIIWPILGGILGIVSWQSPFMVYFFGIPLGILALIYLPEISVQKTQTENKGSVFNVIKENPLIILVFGLMFFGMLLLYSVVIFLPKLLETINLSSPLIISLFLTLTTFSAGITSFYYAKIKSKLSHQKIVVIIFALWGTGFILVSQLAIPLAIGLAFAFFGLGHGILIPTLFNLIGEIVSPEFRGRFVSYLGTFGFIGQFASPIIFSPISKIFGLQGIFLIAGILSALLFSFFFSSKNKHCATIKNFHFFCN